MYGNNTAALFSTKKIESVAAQIRRIHFSNVLSLICAPPPALTVEPPLPVPLPHAPLQIF